MKFVAFVLSVLVSSSVFAKVETRCGWISNPTPANYWIVDADDLWVIGAQGGYQAEGEDLNYPESEDQMVYTNGNYGYWCGCIKGDFDKSNSLVLKVISSFPKTLKACLEDPNLPAN